MPLLLVFMMFLLFLFHSSFNYSKQRRMQKRFGGYSHRPALFLSFPAFFVFSCILLAES